MPIIKVLLLLILWVSFSAISAPDALIKSTNKSVDKSISQELENFIKINSSITNNSQNDVNDRLELLYNNIINASKRLGDSELLKLIQSVEYFLLETPNSLKGVLAFVDIWEALISMDTEYLGPDDRSAIYETPVFPLKTISPGDYTNKLFKMADYKLCNDGNLFQDKAAEYYTLINEASSMSDKEWESFSNKLSDEEVIRRTKIVNRKCSPLKEITFVDSYLKLTVMRLQFANKNFGESSNSYSDRHVYFDKIAAGFNNKRPLPKFVLDGAPNATENDIRLYYTYLTKLWQYRFMISSQNMPSALTAREYIDTHYDNFILSHFKMFGSYYDLVYLLDIFNIYYDLGRYGIIVDKIEFLLSKFNDDDSRPNIKAKRALFRELAWVHLKLKNKILAEKNNQIADNLASKLGRPELGVRYGQLLATYLGHWPGAEHKKNLNKAKVLIEKKIPSCLAYPKQDIQVCLDDIKNVDNLIKAYETQKDKEILAQAEINYYTFEAESAEREILMGYWDSDANKGSYSDLSSKLESYEQVMNHFDWAEKPNRRAFWGKKWINTFQLLRQSLTGEYKKEKKQLTSNYSDMLKELADLYFLLGDTNTSIACLKIIQQNEFLDFVRRREAPEDYFIQIDETEIERDYEIKIKDFARQQDYINLKIHSDTSRKAQYIKALSQLKLQRDMFLKKYGAKLKLAVKAKKREIKKTTMLSKGEAEIYLAITKKKLRAYFFTLDNEGNPVKGMIEESIDKLELGSNVLSFHKDKALGLEVDRKNEAYLTKNLVNPISDYLKTKNITKIKIRNDSELNLLPFSALKYKGKYLSELYTIEKLGIVNDNRSEDRVSKIDMFGASKTINNNFTVLPNVEDELNAISKLKINRSIKREYYLNTEFNKNNFYNSFSNLVDTIHISTHFRLIGNIADKSKMLMGDGSTLTLAELSNDLPKYKSNLVVLSACDTGNLGTTKDGVSSVGLSRIFQDRGAKYVLSSLWKISDKGSADFMTLFYSLLFNNDIKPPEALRLTQNAFSMGSIDALPENIILLKDNYINKVISNMNKKFLIQPNKKITYQNPYFWAAFQIDSI